MQQFNNPNKQLMADIDLYLNDISKRAKIQRERNIMSDLHRYNDTYDYLYYPNGVPNTNGGSEAFGMTYWFDKTMPEEERRAIAERFYYWCEQSETQLSLPTPYVVSYNTGIVQSHANSQHFLWAAKAFLDHYIRYGEVKYLDKAKEIVDWVIANMVVGTTPDRRILRLTDTNKVSIKTLSSADVLLRLSSVLGDTSYKELYDENLNWINANNNFTGGYLYREEVDATTPIETAISGSHPLCEMIDGLLDAYKITGVDSYYDLAYGIFTEAVMPYIDWYSGKSYGALDGFATFQISYIAKKLGLIDLSELSARYALSMRNSDGSFRQSFDVENGNIFAYCYYMAFLHTSNLQRCYSYIPQSPLWECILQKKYTPDGTIIEPAGVENTDYQWLANGLKLLTTTGKVVVDLPTTFDTDDFAILIAWDMGDVADIDTNSCLFRIHDVTTTNNDIYCLFSSTEILVQTRLAGVAKATLGSAISLNQYGYYKVGLKRDKSGVTVVILNGKNELVHDSIIYAAYTSFVSSGAKLVIGGDGAIGTFKSLGAVFEKITVINNPDVGQLGNMLRNF